VALLTDSTPTSAPTFTRRPPSTATQPPNTPLPPTATPLPSVITYTVASGDTLSGISQRFNVGTNEILGANQDGLASPHSLSIGQQLRIPVAPPESAEVPPGESAGQEPALPGDSPGVEVSEDLGTPPAAVATAGLEAAVIAALGLPTDAPGVAAPVPGTQASGSAREQQAGDVLRSEKSAAVAFAAPVPVGPAAGATVTGESPLLRWSSSGLLPAGAHYVVAIREADAQTDAAPRLLWVLSNATAVRVPGVVRPSLGTSRSFEWTVSVRRRSGRLLGSDEGELLSPKSEVRAFVWAP
jgi:murein DD-endopeptidase MepM/ murein hydrolase activator NlpD